MSGTVEGLSGSIEVGGGALQLAVGVGDALRVVIDSGGEQVPFLASGGGVAPKLRHEVAARCVHVGVDGRRAEPISRLAQLAFGIGAGLRRPVDSRLRRRLAVAGHGCEALL